MLKFNTFFLSACILSGVTLSQPSQALVAGLAGATPIAMAGLYVASGSFVGSIAISQINCALGPKYACNSSATRQSKIRHQVIKWGANIAAIGIVVLESEQSVQFTHLSESQGEALHLSVQERESFNTELDQVNMMFAQVSQTLGQDGNVEQAASLWNELSGTVSTDTFSAMTKISAQ